MSLPDLEALTLPILQHVAAGLDTIAKMAVPIGNEFGLSEEEREHQDVYPTGKRRPFYRRLRYAAHCLVRAGLLTSPARGKYTITDRGRAMLANPAPPVAEAAKS
jgi:restriction system protein